MNTRLTVTGPHRESGTIPGEYGYGDYYRAVERDAWGNAGKTYTLAYMCIGRGVELTKRLRCRLLARGRRAREAAYA